MTLPAAFSFKRKSLLAGLVLALLWAQSIGLVHRLVHPAPASLAGKEFCAQPVASSQGEERQRAQCDGHSEGHSYHAGLMGHFESAPGEHSKDCRLFDQLAQGEAIPCSGQLLFPLPRFDFNSPNPAPGYWHTFTALYAARAPPLIL